MQRFNFENGSSQLYHHGIKGMRWGVRRFQNRNGSLTNAGKKRYDNTSSKEKSKHQQKIETKFRNSGMSKKDAETAAINRMRTEKVLLAIGGTTLAAAAAYVATRKIREKADGIIKAGTTLQRIEMTNEGKLYNAFYAAKDRSDKTKYAGMLGLTRQAQTGKSYLMNIGTNKDIKIAGRDKAINTFKKLYDNDPEFKKAASSLVKNNVHGRNTYNGNIKKMYDNFNSNFVYRDNSAVKKFYEVLKSEGYGAVRDVNDMKFSGYKAKNPLIIFGQTNNVTVQNVRELSKNEAYKKFVIMGAKQQASILAKLSAAGATVGALSMYKKDMSDDEIY